MLTKMTLKNSFKKTSQLLALGLMLSALQACFPGAVEEPRPTLKVQARTVSETLASLEAPPKEVLLSEGSSLLLSPVFMLMNAIPGIGQAFGSFGQNLDVAGTFKAGETIQGQLSKAGVSDIASHSAAAATMILLGKTPAAANSITQVMKAVYETPENRRGNICRPLLKAAVTEAIGVGSASLLLRPGAGTMAANLLHKSLPGSNVYLLKHAAIQCLKEEMGLSEMNAELFIGTLFSTLPTFAVATLDLTGVVTGAIVDNALEAGMATLLKPLEGVVSSYLPEGSELQTKNVASLVTNGVSAATFLSLKSLFPAHGPGAPEHGGARVMRVFAGASMLRLAFQTVDTVLIPAFKRFLSW